MNDNKLSVPNNLPVEDARVGELAVKIHGLVQSAKVKVAREINSAMVNTYWEIGRHIVEFEQNGNPTANYGSSLLTELAKQLTARLGSGYSRPNLNRMRQFYLTYPICSTLSNKLSWSHICELLTIEDDLERQFYEKACISERWSVRDFKRQKESGLFLRLAASRDKEGIMKLAGAGLTYDNPEDIVKDTYTLEFLGIPAKERYSEKDLESALIANLTKFLLELGKGFTFQARQYPIVINNEHYYIDLVFYHKKLHCPVLIDLKIGAVKHKDIGQMNMYMGYFAKEELEPGDNPPIGIILSREKDELMVEYATYGMDQNLFVSKYELYLPDKDQLRALIAETLSKQTND